MNRDTVNRDLEAIVLRKLGQRGATSNADAPRSEVALSSSSPFSPSQLSGLVTWYDAGRIDAVAIPDGTTLPQWDDLSGNRNHATATGTAQPIVSTLRQNGLRFLTFNGTSNAFNIATLSATQPFTVCAAARGRANPSATSAALGFYPNAGLFITGPSGPWQAFAGGTFNHTQTGDGVWRKIIVVFNAASSTFFIDGTEVTGNPGAGAIGPSANIGKGNGTQWWKGDIGELFVVSGAASSTVKSQIATYLSRWTG